MRRFDPTSINLPGAVDLSARSAPSAGGGSGGGGGGAGANVVDVTEATFQTEVVDRSRTVPVVLDFWASWCGPCRQLSPILEKLAAGDGGSWVLAKIDVDANPRLAQAAAVQGIPAVKAVVDGQLVAEFTGALPERQVRGWIDQIVALARKGGAAGPGESPGDDDSAGMPPPPALEPEIEAAYQALEAGDLDGAAQHFQTRLSAAPEDPEAKSGLAQVELARRLGSIDQAELQRRVQTGDTSRQTRLEVADLLVASGDVDNGLAGLIELVRESSGDERDEVRQRLLNLFDMLGDHPAVAPARRALSNALF